MITPEKKSEHVSFYASKHQNSTILSTQNPRVMPRSGFGMKIVVVTLIFDYCKKSLIKLNSIREEKGE